jgi:Uma2 family endonuclease
MSTQSASSEIYSPTPVVLSAPVGALTARKFSVDEYHRMIESAILTENDRVQLVDGWIVEMPPIGPGHITSSSLAGATFQSCLPPGWTVRLQGPITLTNSEPEPDLVVVRGKLRDYTKHHPGGRDIALVVEIADTTLSFDRGQKAAIYAAAGIPEYWIVNLVDRQLETHRDPQTTASGAEYRIREVVDASGSVALSIAGQQEAQLKVADLLP